MPDQDLGETTMPDNAKDDETHAEHTVAQHEHAHGCGHEAVKHGDHVDFVHDGHRHYRHDDHYDEH